MTNSDADQEKFTYINQLLVSYPSLMDAYQQLEPFILQWFGAERMSIFMRRRQHQDLLARYKTGTETLEINVPISPMSIAGYVALSQLPLLVNNPYDKIELANIHKKLNFAEKFDRGSAFKTRNIICVPILDSGVVMGILQIINKIDGAFSAVDLSLSTKVSDILGQKFRYELGGTREPFDYLVHRQVIDAKPLQQLSQSSHDNKQLAQRLMAEYKVPEDELGLALAVHYQVPYIPFVPDKYHLYQSESKLNLSYLKRNLIAIITDTSGKPIVLMAEPSNATLLMEIESALSMDSYDISVSLPSVILQYLGETANEGKGTGAIDDILDEIGSSTEESDELNEEMPDDAPAVVRLVSRVLHDAARLNASDIHIDPEKNAATRVRMRIDGVCRDITQIPASHHNAVIARIKIMSNLNIAENRVPQDGKLAFRKSGQLIEVRVATIPTVAGEGVVMRILAAGGAMPIHKLNLSPTNQAKITELIQQPHGIILVVGPTGSGKTTTLHGILGHINTPDKKIWTAEDPVEITQPGLQQVQVSPKIGLTFAHALRAFLRADPDIILIGEMRDKETAHAGIEASLTGHLVFSTLHTNSAPETITRLLDLGLDPVNFSDACVGILAQRLIRTICPSCKEQYPATTAEIAFIHRQYGKNYLAELNLPEQILLYKGQGCSACADTGYRGRTGVHELLSMSNNLRSLVYKHASVNTMKEQAMSDGMRTLTQDCIVKLLNGYTDIAQVQIISGASFPH
ncbi:GspE/PulE family protein [Paraglaciecola aquimarina]|uniref:GspE/PulE family protein n=1 Tax=Paraglaciecola aquimarina TaxID=1235557 RepID=A0ABU3SSV3_9ALTE|nr:GspE/PulE family protein [Paraglaciecola aquimarina]MDU0353065.1 GspE/PulE family protein [Paraglaciecola aquimarina]